MLTDNEIIKAFECCSNADRITECGRCPYYRKGCLDKVHADAIDLINRQKIEIESLKIANEKMYDVNKKQEAEIEEVRYKLECLLCHATGGKLSKSTYSLRTMEAAVTDFMQELDEEVVEEATVNAVKELAEIIVADYPEMEYYLNELVKEFTEGEQK